MTEGPALYENAVVKLYPTEIITDSGSLIMSPHVEDKKMCKINDDDNDIDTSNPLLMDPNAMECGYNRKVIKNS